MGNTHPIAVSGPPRQAGMYCSRGFPVLGSEVGESMCSSTSYVSKGHPLSWSLCPSPTCAIYLRHCYSPVLQRICNTDREVVLEELGLPLVRGSIQDQGKREGQSPAGSPTQTAHPCKQMRSQVLQAWGSSPLGNLGPAWLMFPPCPSQNRWLWSLTLH